MIHTRAMQNLTLVLVLSLGVNAAAATRRGVLQGGAFSLLSGWLRPVASAPQMPTAARAVVAPAVPVKSASESLRQARAISQMFSNLQLNPLRIDGGFTPHAYEIIQFWKDDDPATRGFIDGELEELKRLEAQRDRLSTTDPKYIAQANRCHDQVNRIASFITERPYSQWRWGELIAPRVVAAQDKTAARLGVEVSDVQRLFEHLWNAPSSEQESLVDAVMDDQLFAAVPPIYSGEAIAVFIEELRSASPHLAERVREKYELKGLHQSDLQTWIAGRSDLFSYDTEYRDHEAPIQFEFQNIGGDVWRADGNAHIFVAEYVKSLQYLSTLKSRLNLLKESLLRDRLIQQIDDWSDEMNAELLTLPQRLEAVRAYYHDEDNRMARRQKAGVVQQRRPYSYYVKTGALPKRETFNELNLEWLLSLRSSFTTVMKIPALAEAIARRIQAFEATTDQLTGLPKQEQITLAHAESLEAETNLQIEDRSCAGTISLSMSAARPSVELQEAAAELAPTKTSEKVLSDPNDSRTP